MTFEIHPERCYVWVFVPSQVRTNFLYGVACVASDWRYEYEVDSYNEAEAAADILAQINAANIKPLFYSADEFDAPRSASLCAALSALAKEQTNDR